MKTTNDLFHKLETCVGCTSNRDCSLATFRSLPKQVFRWMVANLEKKEQQLFYHHLSECPVKSEKILKEKNE